MPKKKKLSRQDREAYWIVGTMVAIIVVFLASYFIYLGFQSFEYNGLDFDKVKFGELDLFRHTFYVENPSGGFNEANLNLRIDPRDNRVPVDGEIVFPGSRKVFMSVNPDDFNGCNHSLTAWSHFALFISANLYSPQSATTNLDVVNETEGYVYANCETHPNNAVLLFEKSNETRIVRETDSCYVFEFENCEVLDVVEKFEVQSLIDARERALS